MTNTQLEQYSILLIELSKFNGGTMCNIMIRMFTDEESELGIDRLLILWKEELELYKGKYASKFK